MTIQTKATLNSNINFVQLKLFDFADENINFNEKLDENVFNSSKSNNAKKNVGLFKDKHFHMINPVCPDCGKSDYSKQGFYKINPTFDNGEKVELFLQRYYCKKCDKKFSTSLFDIKNKYNRFSKQIKDKIRKSKVSRGGSLRDMVDDIKTFLNLDISHQTIKNWLKIDENKIIQKRNRIQLKFTELSGFYVVDEQFVNIDGKRKYRVTIHDIFYKTPIAEEIMTKRSKRKIKKFISDITKNQPKISITTDGLPIYKKIADELGFIHQKCIFHQFKDMHDKILKEIKKNKYTTIEKIETCRILTELKNVFRTYNEEESLKRFETLLNKSEQFIKVLRTYIHKKIIPDFQRLTNYTRNNFIPRTSNQAEQWYSNSTKHQNKKKYKTTEGLLEYLALKMTKNQL